MVLAMLALLPPAASGSETVIVCDVYGNHAAPMPSGVLGIGATNACPGDPADIPPSGGMEIYTVANRTIKQGSDVAWTVNAPFGLLISSAYVPHMYSYGIDDGHGWAGGFLWLGGTATVSDLQTAWSSPTLPGGGSPYFGWQVACFANPCTNGGNQWLSVELLELNMVETVAPTLNAPGGLWNATGWIRGNWQLNYYGDSPSGICTMNATLNGQLIQGSASALNQTVFHQCSAPAVQETIDTSKYGNGLLPMTLNAIDAAGLSANYRSSVAVDNVPVGLNLNGPTDAPVTAGTQYITATATAGPSGVNGIACSLDGSPYHFYPGSSTQLAVQGVGVHQASCYARNNALSSTGVRATSPVKTWTLSIRDPSVASVAFSRVVDALRCAKKRERVRIPAHWATATYHGHKVRVRVPAQTKTVTVVHCHPRIVRRRVIVHGRVKIVKVVLVPHTVLATTKHVRHGVPVEVSGWVGTANGNALAGVPVRLMTAPDDGSLHFTQAGIVTTAANGSWTGRLPAGPSRLVEAVYDGAATVEPTASAPVQLVVPASVKLRIKPRSTHWGSTISIRGRVNGGYVPRAGELVILRIGWRGGSTEIGHIYTDRGGRFHTKYTFLRGNGTVTYRLWAASARESDYPYAPSTSRRLAITVRQ